MKIKVLGCVAAVVFAGCDCGRVGLPSEQNSDAGVDDAGFVMMAPDSGAADAGTPDAGPEQALEVAVIGQTGAVLAVRLDGGARVLAATDGGFAYRHPRWRPGHDDVAMSDGRSAFILENGQLTKVPKSTSSSAPYQGDTSLVAWSPDGRRLAIDGTESTTDARSVFLVPGDGGFPELLAIAERWAWSRDGEAIYFSRFDSQVGAVVTGRVDVGSRQLTTLAEAQFLDVSHTGEPIIQARGTLVDGGTGDVVSLLHADGGRTALFADGLAATEQREGVVASPWTDEAVLRGNRVVGGVFSYQAVRTSLTGQRDVLHESSMDDAPTCFAFVPDGDGVSFMSGSSLVIAPRAGGVVMVPAPPLDPAGSLTCADWHYTAR